jgi:hypothetical protein
MEGEATSGGLTLSELTKILRRFLQQALRIRFRFLVLILTEE